MPGALSAEHPSRTLVGPTRRPWTTREERILREHYPAGGWRACAPHLPDRTDSAIRVHAQQIGLRAPPPAPPARTRKYVATPEIDAAIHAIYQGEYERGAIARLAREIGWPDGEVSRRALALGLRGPREKDAQRHWHRRELEIVAERLDQDVRVVRRALLVAGFRRAEGAVGSMMWKMRRGERGAGDYTAFEVASLLGICPGTVSRWLRLGWLDAEKRGSGRTEQQGGDSWRITREALRSFIVKNSNLIDLRKVTDRQWFIELLAGRGNSP